MTSHFSKIYNNVPTTYTAVNRYIIINYNYNTVVQEIKKNQSIKCMFSNYYNMVVIYTIPRISNIL